MTIRSDIPCISANNFQVGYVAYNEKKEYSFFSSVTGKVDKF